jgi:hypothetical protein
MDDFEPSQLSYLVRHTKSSGSGFNVLQRSSNCTTIPCPAECRWGEEEKTQKKEKEKDSILKIVCYGSELYLFSFYMSSRRHRWRPIYPQSGLRVYYSMLKSTIAYGRARE